jgi:hypothetical protein
MGFSFRGLRCNVPRRDRSGASAEGQFERDKPCHLAPRYRFRVVLGSKVGGARRKADDAAGKGKPPQVVWYTSDLEYARLLATWLNAAAGCDRAWVEAWNRASAASQSRWIRLRASSPRS